LDTKRRTSNIEFLTVVPQQRWSALVRGRALFQLFICALAFSLGSQAPGDQSGPFHSQREFKIGVLVSLTGSGFSLGRSTVAALQIAEEQIEAEAISQHADIGFNFLYATLSRIP
jgi:ABC-type branched-subunit amino acid transport system substrate-binding protein